MLILWIMGCNGINETEAEQIFSALYEPLSDIRDSAIESQEDEISITLTLGASWEGEATASGTKIEDGLKEIFPLTVNLTEVYVATDDITLNGTLSFGVEYFLDPTDVASYEKTATVDGELTISGKANGIADVAYQFVEKFDNHTGTLDYSASGTISDIDVGQFTSGATE